MRLEENGPRIRMADEASPCCCTACSPLACLAGKHFVVTIPAFDDYSTEDPLPCCAALVGTYTVPSDGILLDTCCFGGLLALDGEGQCGFIEVNVALDIETGEWFVWIVAWVGAQSVLGWLWRARGTVEEIVDGLCDGTLDVPFYGPIRGPLFSPGSNACQDTIVDAVHPDDWPPGTGALFTCSYDDDPGDNDPGTTVSCEYLVNCPEEFPLLAFGDIRLAAGDTIEDQTDPFSDPVADQTYDLVFEYSELNAQYDLIEVTDIGDLPTTLQPFYSDNRLLWYAPLGESGNYSNHGIRIINYAYDDAAYKHEEHVYGILFQLTCVDGEVFMPVELYFAVQTFRGHTSGSWPTQTADGSRSLTKLSDPPETPGKAYSCKATSASARYGVSFDARDLALDLPDALISVNIIRDL